MKNWFNVPLFLALWLFLFGVCMAILQACTPQEKVVPDFDLGSCFAEPPESLSPKVEPGSTSVENSNCRVFTREEIEMMAKVLYAEAGAVESDMYKAAVVWVMLNHLDNGFHGDTIEQVVTYPNALAYDESTPLDEDLIALVTDVVTRYNWERQGLTEIGRVIPPDYLYFYGDGEANHFMNTWPVGEDWDWSLPNPYSS